MVVDGARDGCPHPGEMGPAVNGVDRIGERIDQLGIGVGVLQRYFDPGALDFLLNVTNGMKSFPVSVQVADE